MEKERANLLRQKRVMDQTEREYSLLRKRHGEALVNVISQAIGKSINLADFDVGDTGEPAILWDRNIENSDGLVCAYSKESKIRDILECVKGRLDRLSGKIGFHDKPYLGVAKIQDIDPLSLLSIAKATEDAVVFFSESPRGVLMIDCYMGPSEPFSIIVQGDELTENLSLCFSGP